MPHIKNRKFNQRKLQHNKPKQPILIQLNRLDFTLIKYYFQIIKI